MRSTSQKGKWMRELRKLMMAADLARYELQRPGNRTSSDVFNWSQKHNATIDEIRSLRTRIQTCYFDKLPIELIRIIFAEYCSHDPDAPLIISLVSKSWLQIALTSPELWTRLVINDAEPHFAERAEQYVSLSANRPLDVRVYFPISKDLAMPILRLCSKRWKSLEIVEGRSATSSRERWQIAWQFPQANEILDLLQSFDFPQLEEVDIQLPPLMYRAKVYWSNVFTKPDIIHNKFLQDNLLGHLSVNLNLMEFSQFFDLLVASPGLLSINVLAQRQRRVDPAHPTELQIISFPALKKLQLNEASVTPILIHTIDCPQVREVEARLSMRDVTRTFPKILGWAKLTRLKLDLDPTTSCEPLAEFTFPCLTYIHITCSNQSYNTNPVPSADRLLVDVASSIISLLLHASVAAKSVELITNIPLDWAGIFGVLKTVELLSIDTIRGSQLFLEGTEICANPEPMHRLQSLRVERLADRGIDSLLGLISAPMLTALALLGNGTLDGEIFFPFLSRCPLIQSLHVEGLRLVPIPSNSITLSNVQELVIPDNGSSLACQLDLPSLIVLRLLGTRQGQTEHRGRFHYDPHIIELEQICNDLRNTSIMGNITYLDLCQQETFPYVRGFQDSLLYLDCLERISLPRAYGDTPILIDVLFAEMLEEQVCPQLKEISSGDYPELEPVLRLLDQRNRCFHIKACSCPFSPIECFYLPALPHPVFLESIQAALAGKFPDPAMQLRDWNGETVVGETTDLGCDDCRLSGWKCPKIEIVKDSTVHSTCSRHKTSLEAGMRRITADS